MSAAEPGGDVAPRDVGLDAALREAAAAATGTDEPFTYARVRKMIDDAEHEVSTMEAELSQLRRTFWSVESRARRPELWISYPDEAGPRADAGQRYCAIDRRLSSTRSRLSRLYEAARVCWAEENGRRAQPSLGAHRRALFDEERDTIRDRRGEFRAGDEEEACWTCGESLSRSTSEHFCSRICERQWDEENSDAPRWRWSREVKKEDVKKRQRRRSSTSS